MNGREDEETRRRELSVTLAKVVLVVFVLTLLGYEGWKWYHHVRPVNSTRYYLRCLSSDDKHMLKKFEAVGVEDGWGTKVVKEENQDGHLFRSAGPDREFKTDDDLTSEVVVKQHKPQPKAAAPQPPPPPQPVAEAPPVQAEQPQAEQPQEEKSIIRRLRDRIGW